MVQVRPEPDPDRYFGRGKLDELKAEIKRAGANLVACDDELAPRQERNLEAALDVPVIDRTAIILDIFADHAHSAEGKLQVELAQLEYNLARMRGLWTHLERLGAGRMDGGIGTRGPGESQIETDRRLARDRISALRRRLERVERNRGVMRARRESSAVPSVALAGYTNAGKSTLLNALTGAGVSVGERLFHTLDPTTRSYEHDGRQYLVTDTVGFIRKLPHQLVEAFKATLEETTLADLLVHVVDGSAPKEERLVAIAAVDSVLDEIGAGDQPRLLVFNKLDLLDDDERRELLVGDRDAIGVSAATGEGIDELRDRIERAFDETLREVELLVPYDEGGRLSELYELAGEHRAQRARRRRPGLGPDPGGHGAPLRGLCGQRQRRLRRPRLSRRYARAVKLGFIRLRDDARIPTRAHDGDAGLDLLRGRGRADRARASAPASAPGIAVEIPRRPRRPRAPALGPGARPRDRARERPGPDRQRLPRRAAGAAAEHGPRASVRDRRRRPDRPAGGRRRCRRGPGRGRRAQRERPRRGRLRLVRRRLSTSAQASSGRISRSEANLVAPPRVYSASTTSCLR